ncbi:hypothetical protein [Nocardia altamirensis]|uniref:hypothetical protein n=1 Tax=Nocardia altamirensis TaxID=472158 RepID=UPI0008400BFC|nr:hypothetical protein [Nocardia altamirensis]
MSIRFIGGYVALVAILLFVWASSSDRSPVVAVSLLAALGAMIALNLWVRMSARAAKQKAPRPNRGESPSGRRR